MPLEFLLTAISSEPAVIWPSSSWAMRFGIWSLPPATWYISLDGPKMRSWPWPE